MTLVPVLAAMFTAQHFAPTRCTSRSALRGIVHLDSEVPHGGLELSVPEQQLDGT
jgi:hypothetical protein